MACSGADTVGGMTPSREPIVRSNNGSSAPPATIATPPPAVTGAITGGQSTFDLPDAATPPDASVPLDAGPTPDDCMDEGSERDIDGDGLSPAEGDCDDCQAGIRPGAFDFPGNGVDEDCSGADAPSPESCSDGIAMESDDADDGARAIGLCQFSSEASGDWGVIEATWTWADGTPAANLGPQKGILPDFGQVKPREGANLLALSSGVARAPDQPGYTTFCDDFSVFGPLTYGAPEGFPIESPACPDVESGQVRDPAALELKIRVPLNAAGLTFDSNFFTYEFSDYICSPFNDYFVALLLPKPDDAATANVAFDDDGNPISVNNALLRVCEPGMYGGKMFDCSLGAEELVGTSFEGTAQCGDSGFDTEATHAATGWLRTQAPVTPGSVITLRLAIWDSGDNNLDSLVLVDNFQWVKAEFPDATPDEPPPPPPPPPPAMTVPLL